MEAYYLKQKALSLRASYRVLDESQNPLYECKTRWFSPSQKTDIVDVRENRHVYTLKRKVFSFMPTHLLLDPQGNEVASMRQRFAMRGRRVTVTSPQGEYEVTGNYWAHEFTIYHDDKEVANIRKKWLSWGDTYEIIIHDDKNTEFLLAMVLMIDRKFHSKKSSNRHR